MSLRKYQGKRSFNKTPEPRGRTRKKIQSQLHFVIHKHAASHLHYDLRLEMAGVLKSWAVPKGPSLNPLDKRLAIAVEDHPYDYKDFEGVIPKGNYGAGQVIIWDEGFYEPSVALAAKEDSNSYFLKALAKGHLKFILHGTKLQGEFHLIKLSNRGENAWLFFKADDAFATKKDILKADKSVRSQLSIEQVSHPKNPAALAWSSLPKAPIPEMIPPMLATLIAEPFDRDNWFFEIKWDGFRILAYAQGKRVKLLSRNQKDYSQVFEPITAELSRGKLKAVFDGEMVVVDASGRSHFQLLQQWQEQHHEGQLIYYVFDLLWCNGYDLRQLPLRQRKEILMQLLPEFSQIKLSEAIEGRGKAFFKTAVEHDLEGIIGKDADSSYLEGKRSRSWVKIKSKLQQEAIICGYTAPRGSRKLIGALILGLYENHQLKYIGHTDGALDEETKAELKKRLDRLQQTDPAFAKPPKPNAAVTWVKPQLVCEVSFREWTQDGHLRQPIFLGLRTDKLARAVRRELVRKPEFFQAEEAKDKEEHTTESSRSPSSPRKSSPKKRKEESSKEESISKDTQIMIVNKQRIKLSHVSKIYWPKEGYSKMDLLNYYRSVAKLLLPHLKDRPEVLHRYPNGIHGESFYQKNFPEAPEWLETEEIYSKTERHRIEYLLCQNTASLMYLINLGCIELNPWLSRIGSLDNPDFCVIDLDPEDINFAAVIKTAQTTHHLLEQIGADSFCKTSGATGLHIFIPLGAKYSYDQSKQFAQLIATLVNMQLPEITSIKRMPAQRQGKVYIDYLQNRHGQTLAAPYSVRPRPKAPVSTPLHWHEVKKGLKPELFTINTIHARLEQIGDIWPKNTSKGIDLPRCLKKLEGLMQSPKA